jgi:uncharacterized repeat protein (TIGR02543 family)
MLALIKTKTWLFNAITWAEELGMYAIVDYHVLTPGNPLDYLNSTGQVWQTATDFFEDVSTFVKQHNYKHVIYEICNEPNGAAATWTAIRTFADAVLPIIANNDPNAVVIVGTRQWSQILTDPRDNPVTPRANLQIIYTFHIYACEHGNLLTSQFTDAMLRRIPVFVTEWNDTQASGAGSCGTPPSTNATTFINRCNNTDTQSVSWTAWSWSPTGSGENQTSASWKGGTPTNGTGYTVSNLSPTGKMMYDELQQNHINYPPDCPDQYTVTFDTGTGGSAVPSRTVCAGETVPQPQNPSRPGGFAFAGWNNGAAPFVFTTPINVDITLTAQWTPTTNTVIADCDTGHRTGFLTHWYSFNDNSEGGASTVNPNTDLVIFRMTAPGANDSDSAAVITYTLNRGGLGYAPFVGFGFDTNDPLAPFNLSCASGVTFFYRNTSGNPIRFMVKTSNVTDNAYFGFDLPHSATWIEIAINWTQLAQPSGWGTSRPWNAALITGFQWQVQATSGTGTAGVDQVQLNDCAVPLPMPTPVSVASTENTTFSIYPNPAKEGNFNVLLPNSGTATLTIVNLQGQTVYTAEINNGFAAVNARLRAGIYMVSVQSENEVKTQKLIIKKTE